MKSTGAVLLTLLLTSGVIAPLSLDQASPSPRRRRSIAHVDYAPGDGFRPIRITVRRGATTGLDAGHVRTLDAVVAAAVRRLESAVRVNRVSGALRLARPGGCKFWHLSGVNRDRCASPMEGYNGDFCLDDFRIPDDHQVGLNIFNKDSTSPIQVIFRDGAGLTDTDFVLYVQSVSTIKCVREKVVAYARHCQQDQNQRPVAGYANFCPEEFLSSDVQYAVKTATHELVHALGFAEDLFHLFQTCTPNTCPPIRDIDVRADPQERFRVSAPTLSSRLRSHFGCSNPEFGALLHPGPTRDSYSSHWDPIFLQGSLMTPSVERLAYLSLFDEFTLALLQDTGWYRVNFSAADPFLWGRGKGCEFAMYSDPELTCTQNELGCHYLHLDKSVCELIPGAGNMQVAGQSCLYTTGNAAQAWPTFQVKESYSKESRCFMVRISNTTWPTESLSFYPHCFSHRCVGVGGADLQLDLGSGWFHCPFGKFIDVDYPTMRASIKCPPRGPLCGHFNLNLDDWPQISPPVTTPNPTSPKPDSSSSSSPSIDTVGLIFNDVSFRSLYESPSLLFMLASKVKRLALQMNVSAERFEQPSVSPYFNDSVVVLIKFLPSSSSSSSSQHFLHALQRRLTLNGLALDVYNVPFIVSEVVALSAASRLPPSPFDVSTPSTDSSLIVAAVLGAVAAVVLLLVVGFCFRSKTPKRAPGIAAGDGAASPPAGVYPLNARTLFLSNSEVDARPAHYPYIHPHHLQHMEMRAMGTGRGGGGEPRVL